MSKQEVHEISCKKFERQDTQQVRHKSGNKYEFGQARMRQQIKVRKGQKPAREAESVA